MGRPHRTLIPGGVYHVTARGTGPIEIYRNDVDRRCFMHRLVTVERRFAWIRRALCLMGTHYRRQSRPSAKRTGGRGLGEPGGSPSANRGPGAEAATNG